jgi:hypothetical protein
MYYNVYELSNISYSCCIWAASRHNQHSGFVTSMDPDQPVHPCSLIRNHAVRLITNPISSRETDSEQHRTWSDCADAQAGLDPCWLQTHYVGFVMTRLIYTLNAFSFGYMCAGIISPCVYTLISVLSVALSNVWRSTKSCPDISIHYCIEKTTT